MNIEEVRVESLSADMGESFYGDESFDMEELDREGFEGLDEITPEPGDGTLY